jgi:5-methylcytosine-specific restriction endonuclease McrA
MPYLNLDLDFFEHPKTKRLVGLLGKGAEVLPIKLWCYCGKYHSESGKLTGYSTQEIESIVGWWGEEGQMIEAMLKIGLLHKNGNNDMVIHDWEEHEGHLIYFKKRARQGAAKKWNIKLSTIGKNKQTRSKRLRIARLKGSHTKEQWEQLKQMFDFTCVRCLTKNFPVEKDHIMPLYQGGDDSIQNIQPVCAKCNASKSSESIDFRKKYLISTDKATTEEEAERLLKCLLERLLNACLTPAPSLPSLPSLPSIKKKNTFIKPTIEEITTYCKERNKGIDPQKWFDWYEANGWKVGKNPMKNWKAAVRTWENGKDKKEKFLD